MVSASRWLVGSSRIRMSGLKMSSWARATRFRWPPESVPIFGRRVGDVETRQHGPGIGLDLPAAVHLEFVLEVGHALEGRGVVFSVRYFMTNGLVIADRLHHAAARRKDRLEHGKPLIVRRVLREKGEGFPFARVTRPVSGCSTPAMIRKSVVLPEPLAPIIPILSRSSRPSVTFSKSGRKP